MLLLLRCIGSLIREIRSLVKLLKSKLQGNLFLTPVQELDIRRLPGPACRAYFDLLNEECLVHILRHLSNRPRCKHWATMIDPSDALRILRSGTVLEPMLRAQISVYGIASESTCRLLSAHFKDTALAIGTDAEKGQRLFGSLVFETSSHLVSVSLPSTIWHHLNTTSFPRLTHLHLYYVGDCTELNSILEACPGQLHTLDIESEGLSLSDVSGIAKYCSGLRKFRLSLQEGTPHGIKSVWKTVGPTLEDLTFQPPSENHHKLKWAEDISSRCIMLKKLEPLPGGYCHRNLVHLLKKVGVQLQEVRLQNTGSSCRLDELEEIVSACPNASFSAHVNTERSECLPLFGDRLKLLKITGATPDGVDAAAVPLNSLEMLHVDAMAFVSSKFLFSILSIPKPALRCIRLESRFSDLEDLDFSLRHIDSVEELSCFFYRYSPSAFQKFAVRNVRLKTVLVRYPFVQDICETYATSEAEESACDIVRDFAICPVLGQIVIEHPHMKQKSEKIGHACRFLQGKMADVFIGGFQYYV